MLQIVHTAQVWPFLLEKKWRQRSYSVHHRASCLGSLPAEVASSIVIHLLGRKFCFPFHSSRLAPGTTNIDFNSFLSYHIIDGGYSILTSVLIVVPSLLSASNTHIHQVIILNYFSCFPRMRKVGVRYKWERKGRPCGERGTIRQVALPSWDKLGCFGCQ